MNVVLFSHGRGGRSRHFNLAHPICLGVLGTLVLAILGTAFALGMQLGQRSGQSLGRDRGTSVS